MEFKYTAKDKIGHTITGDVEAPDKKHAIETLRKKDLLILKLEESKGKFPLFSFWRRYGKAKVKMDELVIFARQMATMTESGITVVSTLDTLAEQIENVTFKKVLLDVRNDVNTGSSLSEALGKHLSIFSPYFVNMVKAGESSGMLDEVLNRVATYLEKTSALQKKIRSAMIYPTLVTMMAVVVTTVMIVGVIPVFKEMYVGFGATLPGPTQFLIDISDNMRRFWWLIVLVFNLIAIILRWYVKTDKGRLRIDDFKLKLPIFGELFRKVAVSKFTRTLGTLVKSGVPILSALEIVSKTSGNKVVENAINDVRNSVREGESIAGPMERSKVFPGIVTRMISVGEKTGELEKMLTKIADFYDERINVTVDGLTSLIEPLIIIFLGVVIGGIVICMFLPIFKLSTLVQFGLE